MFQVQLFYFCAHPSTKWLQMSLPKKPWHLIKKWYQNQFITKQIHAWSSAFRAIDDWDQVATPQKIWIYATFDLLSNAPIFSHNANSTWTWLVVIIEMNARWSEVEARARHRTYHWIGEHQMDENVVLRVLIFARRRWEVLHRGPKHPPRFTMCWIFRTLIRQLEVAWVWDSVSTSSRFS